MSADGTKPVSAVSSDRRAVIGRAFAFVLYVLLLDAAVETLWNKSAVRWWIVLPIAAYLGGSLAVWWTGGTLWKRLTWSAKATFSLFVLLGVLAVAVWQPGGVTDGLRLAGLSTSTLLSLVTISAVASASLILLGITYPNAAVKAAIASLAAYAEIGLARGIYLGTSFPALLAGQSDWTLLPRFLQGAFIGTFVVIPAGLLALIGDSVKALGGAEFRRAAFKALALFLSLDMGVAGLDVGRTLSGAQATGVPAQASTTWVALPPDAELSRAMKARLDIPVPPIVRVDEAALKARSLEREMHRLEPDLAALAKSLDPGLESAFSYVRGSIRYEAYSGVLRGAEGAFRSSAGNAYDRSLLLAELLRAKGVETRFVACHLPRDRSEQLFNRIFEPSYTAHSEIESNASPLAFDFHERVTKRARRDYAVMIGSLGSEVPVRATPSGEELLKEIGDHVWAQARTDQGWTDLDSAFLEAKPGDTFCASDGTLDKIPPERHQIVTIRAIAERLTNGSLSTETLLESTQPVVEVIDRPIIFSHASASQAGIGVAGALAGGILGPDAWTPMLWVGGNFHQGSPTSFSDQKRSEPGKPPIGSGLSGLFSTLAGDRYFVSESLEFEIRFPSGQREIARRTLIDRAGIAWRNARSLEPDKLRPLTRDKDGLAFPHWLHNIWFSAGPHDIKTYATTASRAFEWAARANVPDQDRSVPIQDAAWPFAVLNFAFLVYSDHVVVPGLNDSPTRRFYPDSPRIFVVSAGPTGERRGDVPFYGFEYDLTRDHLRGLARNAADERGVVARKIWFGALEGALEHETAALHAVALGGGSANVRSTSALLAPDPAVVTLTPDTAKSESSLTTDPEAAARIAGALKRRAALILPRSVLDGGLAGWWEIDLDGADTRSVLDHFTSWHSAAEKLLPGEPTPALRVINGGGGSALIEPEEPNVGKSGNEYFGMIALGIVLVAGVAAVCWILFREGILRLAGHVQGILNMAAKRGTASAPTTSPQPERKPADPGDCTAERQQELQNDVNTLCHGALACNFADDLPTLEAKRDRLRDCARARNRIQFECYGPTSKPRKVDTDPREFQQSKLDHQQAAGDAGRAVANCDDLIRRQQAR